MKTKSLAPRTRLRFSIFRKQTVFVCISLFTVVSLIALPFLKFYVAQASGSIGGMVFVDYNGNGVKEAIEPGVAGVSVTAFDAANVVSGTATSAANGTYEITNTTGTGTYRVEFTNVPGYLKPGAFGAGAGTSVQFAAGGAANVNFALTDPGKFNNQDDPLTATTLFVNGRYNASAIAGQTSLMRTPYKATGHDFSGTTPNANFKGVELAEIQETGAVYGMAWQSTKDRVYVGAYHKRYSGYGEKGPDAIYVFNKAGDTVGAIELDALTGISNSAGADVHDFTTLAPNGDVYDIGANNASYDGVGKLAFGDIDMSADQKTLFAVNLSDRKIYAINVASGAPSGATLIKSWSAPDATTANRHRPFALAWHQGKLWVGSVDENGSNAFVHSMTPDLSSTTTSESFSLETTVPLNYLRQSYQSVNANSQLRPGNWRSWANDPAATPYLTTAANQGEAGEIAYPQAMLTDIEFDETNSMILGFRDRFGDQTGSNLRFRPADNANTWGVSAGDILRVCGTPTGFAVEGSTNCPTAGGLANSGPGGAASPEHYNWDFWSIYDSWDSSTTPNGAYHWETAQGGLSQVAGKSTILTTAMDPINDFGGGYLRFTNSTGRRENIDTDGATSRATVAANGGYTLYDISDVNLPAPSTFFGKANGLGDIEALTNPAPIEIGNRVWRDQNRNGLQDPGEAALANVQIGLYDQTGTLVSRVETGASGQYLFSSDTVRADANVDGDSILEADYNVNIQPETNYTVAVLNSNFDTNNALHGFAATTANSTAAGSDSSNNAISDVRDSDGTTLGAAVGSGVDAASFGAAFTTGTAGATNHGFDFGFVTTVSIGSNVFLDRNNDGVQQPNGADNTAGNADDETGINGVVVELLFDANNNNSIDDNTTETAAVAAYTTINGGNYFFDNLNPGNYQVRIPASNFANSGALANTPLSSVVSDGADNNQDGDDNGAQTVAGAVVTSPLISLQADAEPTGETFAGGAQDDADDNNGDMTVDFGFVPPVSIGSTVFLDRNNNGVQNPNGADNNAATVADNETGIGGVTVQLFFDADNNGSINGAEAATPIASTTTGTTGSAIGDYFFGGLPPGNYRVEIPANNFAAGSALAFAPVSSTPTATADNRVDGDDNGAQIAAGTVATSPIINLMSASEPLNAAETFQGGAQDDQSGDASGDMTVDFGFVPRVSIGSTIFLDRNNDGLQNPNGADNVAGNFDDETGISGVTVELLFDANNDGDVADTGESNAVVSAVTDSDGNYYFGNRLPGNYQVRIPAVNFTGSNALARTPASSAATDTADNREDGDDNGAQTNAGAVVTSPIISLQADAEPTTSETFQGGAQDDQNGDANGDMTVDFGFVPTASIGSTVFFDRNDDGLQQPNGADNAAGNADDEIGISGVTVELLFDANNDGDLADTGESNAVMTRTTNAGGDYYFGSLLPGNYQVRIPASNFAGANPLANVSLSSSASDTADNGEDGDDNGSQTSAGAVVTSPIIALVIDSERVGAQESFSGGAADNVDDNDGDMTVDFGFTANTYSLGNRVWLDADSDGRIDPWEPGVNDVSLTLLNSDDSIYDNDPNASGTQPLISITANNGYYRFDNLPAGNYKVRINSTNFNPGGALVGYINTSGVTTDDIDSSNATAGENGVDPTTYNGSNPASPRQSGVLSNTITLGSNASEPTGETDLGSGDSARADALTDLTVDFGFYRLNLSGTVFNDANNDGLLNNNDVGRNNLAVRLYDSNNNEVPVGPDGVLNTLDDTTGATNRVQTGGTGASSGGYRFGGLTPGDYVVRIAPPSGVRSSLGSTLAPDPDNNIDNDDNGTPDSAAGFVGQIVGQPITLTPDNEPTINYPTGTTANPTYDFGLFGTTTAVELQRFTQTIYQNGVLLEWQTGSEHNNLGFRIFREQNGKREQINRDIIAGSAFKVGAANAVNSTSHYQWFDQNGGENAVYFVEDVDLDGTASVAQIAEQKFEARGTTAPHIANAELLGEQTIEPHAQTEQPGFARSFGAAASKKAKSAAAQPNLFANSQAVKIRVAGEGWHKVERAALVAAGLPETAALDSLQLFAENLEQALRVNQDGSIEFYGTGLDTNDTDSRVYWLIWNRAAGKRINTIENPSVADARLGSFKSVVTRRERTLYVPSILNGDRENFFGGYVWNGVNRQIVTLDRVGAGEQSLEVDLQGFTTNQHRIAIKFNNRTVGFAELNGQERNTFRFALAADDLREGTNEIQLAEQNGEANITLLEAVRVAYTKQTIARNARLQFAAAANSAVLVDGFASPAIRVFDVTNPADTTEIRAAAIETENGFAVQLAPAAHNRLLVAADASRPTNVLTDLEPNEPSNWRGSNDGASFVILTHKDFAAAAHRLAAHREAGGLKTGVVNVADVYDEYNFGAASRRAVSEFLRDAAANWKTKPEYLLLFGDASADARNYLGRGANNFVPTEFVATETIEAASDDALTDFDRDHIADVATGRLPVRTAAQAQAVVGKLLAHEQTPIRSRSRSALFVADNGFEQTNRELAEALGNNLQVQAINRQDGSTAEIRSRVLEGLNQGASIVTFTGHGSQTAWTSGSLLTADDAAALTNRNRLSLFVNLTCLNGGFAEPIGESLGEALINADDAGAAAVWASSGLTAEDNQKTMAAALYRNFGDFAQMRIGDVLLKVKQNADHPDVRRTWTLFGDPTMRLR